MTVIDDLLPECTVRIDVRDTPAPGPALCQPRHDRDLLPRARMLSSIRTRIQANAVHADHILAVMPSPQTSRMWTEERVIQVDVHRFAADPLDLAVLEGAEIRLTIRLCFSTPVRRWPGTRWPRSPTREKKPLGVPRQPEAEGVGGDGKLAFSSTQIQPGMSGGPLFNDRGGCVTGVVSIRVDPRQALGGYAIPINDCWISTRRFEARTCRPTTATAHGSAL